MNITPSSLSRDGGVFCMPYRNEFPIFATLGAEKLVNVTALPRHNQLLTISNSNDTKKLQYKKG